MPSHLRFRDHGVKVGSGKTRLILELERRLREHRDREVLWLASDAPLTPDMLDELPPAPTVLVVDDAHRRSNLDALLQVVLRRPREWPTLLVLATRPQGTRPLRVQLEQAGWNDSAIIQLDALEPLSDEHAAELARVAIGAGGTQSENLARASEGLPLLATVGGSLIALHKLDAGQALTDQRFRETVLAHWSDEAVGRVGVVEPATVKRLLPVLAAIGPVRETDEALLEQIARFVGCTQEMAVCLAAIEDAGLLSRHGSMLRVVPDVLADHLVATAAVSSVGLDTGFSRRLLEEFANVALPAIVRTLAELDWRLRLQGSKVDLLADAWARISSTLQAGDARARRDLLGILAPIAAFQPQRILDLVQWCIDNPAAPNSDRSAFRLVVTQEQVLEAIPPLLRGCAYHLDLLPRALDLLWRLGRDDVRAENQNPDHGLRVMREIAAYEVGKPLDVQRALLDAARRWLLDGPAAGAAGVTPLAILRHLVALECVSTRWTRMRVTLRSFTLLPEQMSSTRSAALELALAHLDALSPEVAADAIILIKDALRASPDIPDDEDRWDGEQAQLVDRLRAELPRISYRLVPMIRSAVRWHLRHRRDSAVGLAARRLLDALPDDPGASLVRVLVGDLDDFEDDSVIDGDPTERCDRRDQRRREFVRTVASEVITRTDGPAELCRLLDDEVAALERAGGHVGGLGELLSAIVEADSVSGAEVVFLASTGSELLSRQLGGAIAVLVERDHERALRVARRILEDGSAEAILALAFAWSFAPWIGGNLDDSTIEILEQLLRWDDWRVRNHAAQAIAAIWQADDARGRRLIRTVELRGEAEVADKVCEILMHPGGRFLDALSEEDLDHLTDQFAELGTLDHHWIREFLKALGSRRLLKLSSLFLDRIEKASDAGRQTTDRDRKYTPLPYDFRRPGQLGDLTGHPDLGKALRLVRDRTLRPSTLPEWWAPYLFGGLSDSWGQVALTVLAEYIASGDAELISGASHLIREAPSGFIFSQLLFVEELVDASVAASSTCAESVRSDLMHILRSRSGSRVPGRPDPRMVHLRDEARAALEQVRSPHMRAFLMAVADYADATIDDELRRDEELFSRHRD